MKEGQAVRVSLSRCCLINISIYRSVLRSKLQKKTSCFREKNFFELLADLFEASHRCRQTIFNCLSLFTRFLFTHLEVNFRGFSLEPSIFVHAFIIRKKHAKPSVPWRVVLKSVAKHFGTNFALALLMLLRKHLVHWRIVKQIVQIELVFVGFWRSTTGPTPKVVEILEVLSAAFDFVIA
jgi:hypothetical protein